MVFEGPHQHAVALPPCLFKAEKQVLRCDVSVERGKLSHWTRKCLSPGFSLSHSTNAGKAPPSHPWKCFMPRWPTSSPRLVSRQMLAQEPVAARVGAILGVGGIKWGFVSFLKTRISRASAVRNRLTVRGLGGFSHTRWAP